MDKKTDLNAVQLVRRIRDKHAELLQGKSNDEIIEFFRKTAEGFRVRTQTKGNSAANRSAQPSAGGTRGTQR